MRCDLGNPMIGDYKYDPDSPNCPTDAEGSPQGRYGAIRKHLDGRTPVIVLFFHLCERNPHNGIIGTNRRCLNDG